jgi:hypothetical protein
MIAPFIDKTTGIEHVQLNLKIIQAMLELLDFENALQTFLKIICLFYPVLKDLVSWVLLYFLL